MTKLWHMRLGHAGGKSLKTLSDQGFLKGVKTCNLEFCEHCIQGKQTTVKFGIGIHNTKGILITFIRYLGCFQNTFIRREALFCNFC